MFACNVLVKQNIIIITTVILEITLEMLFLFANYATQKFIAKI